MATKEELLERAQELDIEGRSGMNKKELEEAVAAAEANSDSSEGDAQEELKADLSPESQEALDQVEEASGEEVADEAAIELDAHGPLHVAPPAERVMTGAISEEHAKAQEEATKDLEHPGLGIVTEAGEQSGVDRLAPGQAAGEPDYSDYPPPRAEFEAQQAAKEEAKQRDLDRIAPQKSVFYTDGLSGPAEQNLERAYEIPETLQSSDEEESKAGDESLSESAKELKAEEEKKASDEASKSEDAKDEG